MGLDKPVVGDARQYDTLGYNLAVGNGYVLSDNKPNITRAPVFPLFLAGVYKLSGYSLSNARISTCIIGALIVLWIYLVGKESFSNRNGFYAATMAAVYPPLVYVSDKVLSESLFALLLLIGTYFLILTYKRDHSYVFSVLSGFVFGLSVLTRPITLILPVFLLPWVFLSFPLKRGMTLFLLFLITFTVVQVPWVIRNYLAYNTLIVGTVKGGMDLWWSNNPKVLSHEEKLGRQYRYFPDEYKEYSKIELNREAYKLAFSFLKENLSQIPKLLIYKQKNFWNLMAGENIYFNLISLLSYGIILPFYIFTNLRIIFRPDERILFPLIALFFIFVTSVYYGTVRFRMPLEPFILILGTEGMLRLKDRIIKGPLK